jgi:hypothetical protein
MLRLQQSQVLHLVSGKSLEHHLTGGILDVLCCPLIESLALPLDFHGLF